MFNVMELELIGYTVETVVEAIASEAVLTAAETNVLEDLRALQSKIASELRSPRSLQ